MPRRICYHHLLYLGLYRPHPRQRLEGLPSVRCRRGGGRTMAAGGGGGGGGLEEGGGGGGLGGGNRGVTTIYERSRGTHCGKPAGHQG